VTKKANDTTEELHGEALIKEVNARIRLARSYWDAHNNLACRTEREKAMALYNTLSKDEKEKIPQVLRVWLRYRSEKYFGEQRTKPGTNPYNKKSNKTNATKKCFEKKPQVKDSLVQKTAIRKTKTKEKIDEA